MVLSLFIFYADSSFLYAGGSFLHSGPKYKKQPAQKIVARRLTSSSWGDEAFRQSSFLAHG